MSAFYMFVFSLLSVHAQQLHYSLHLVSTDNTLDNNKGLLRVQLGAVDGVICNTGFGIQEAMVACRELGFRLGAMRVGRLGSSMDNESAIIATDPLHRNYMEQVRCSGDELSLAACSNSGWRTVAPECLAGGLADAVTVECKKTPALRCRKDYWLCEQQFQCVHHSLLCDGKTDCGDGSDESSHICDLPIAYRLTTNDSHCCNDGEELREGRVEVRFKGVWGAVCDTSFGRREATVFCLSLGYESGKVIASDHTDPDGQIWLDNVRCDKNTLSTLDQCQHSAFGTYDCEPTEVVAVRCSGRRQIDRPQPNPPTQTRKVYNAVDVQCGRTQLPTDNVLDGGDIESDEHLLSATELRPTQRGKYPWQVSVRVLVDDRTHTHHCGGAIISDRHVLTAGHCIRKYVGESWLAVQIDEISGATTLFHVRAKKQHPLFRNKNNLLAQQHDIALLWLVETIEFSDLVRPVCLPAAGKVVTASTIGKCTVAGWGDCTTGFHSAPVSLIDDQRCGDVSMHGANITKGMICTNYLPNLCNGFSGGPLVCEENGVHSVYGVFSWISDGKPAVFTKVTDYLMWIGTEIQNMQEKT